MPLLKEYESQDECPEYLREYYKPTEAGKLVLNEGLTVENVGGLRKALSEATSKGKALEKVAKQYGDLEEGTWKFEPKFDPSAPDDLAKEIETLKAQLGDKPDIKKLVEEGSKERFEKLQRAHEENVAKIASEKDSAYKALLEKHREVAIDQAITGAIMKNDGKAQYLTPVLRTVADLDDDFSLVLKGSDGNPLMDVDGKPQSLESYVAEMRNDSQWKDAFNAPKASGGGAPGSGSSFNMDGAAKTMQPTEGATFL